MLPPWMNRKWRRRFGVKQTAEEAKEDNIVITDRGAFKLAPVESGDSKAIMPEIFKLQWPLAFSGEPKILVYNHSKSYLAELPVTQSLSELFEGGKKQRVYVIALPTPVGLDIECIISDQDW